MRIKFQFAAFAVLFTFFNLGAFAQSFDGYALYNEQNSKTAYLIDKDGNIAHSWSCDVNANYALALTDDGYLVRGGVYSGNSLTGAAIGGMLQVLDEDADVVWEFVYSNADHVSHHDLCLMPNGNVLLIAWEVKSTAELVQAGVSNTSREKWPTHIIEVEQDGSGGKIVWEWHIWDHLIQDYDDTKDNYGVVNDHPELMDANAIDEGGGRGGDWFHVNGIDYNEDLDQIVMTSRYASEIFIIDHSTTTAEAASHSGGNSGKGGDFLYRWGNPSNYGSSDAQTISAAVHDPRWIKEGRPGAGQIQFFNNSGGSGGGSAVDAIITPEDGYNYTWNGTSYGPTTHDFRHECKANSSGQSASDRMTNGNIFVNVSRQYMYEVDSAGNTVWQYNEGPTKAFRYECNDPGPVALLGANGCGDVSVANLAAAQITVYPNPSTGVFDITGLPEFENYEVVVYDVYGSKVLELQQSPTRIDLGNYSNGNYLMQIGLADQVISKKIILLK